MKNSHGMMNGVSGRVAAMGLLAAVALAGCGMFGAEDDTTTTDSSLFGERVAPCRDLLLEAEQTDDPQAHDEALAGYQACVDAGADGADGRGPAPCYDIIEAVVRLQDDVDEALIRQLHEAYVACVFDFVQGGGEGRGDAPGPQDPARCEWLLDEANARCLDDRCWSEFERAFGECMHEGAPQSDCAEIAHRECEPILDGARPPHDGGPCDADRDFEACLDQVIRACEGDQGPDACLDDHLRRCDALLGDLGPRGEEPPMGEYEACVEEAHRLCLPPPPHDCEQILRDADQRCGDPAMNPDLDPERCWMDHQRAFDACVNGDDPGQDCLRWAERSCDELMQQGGVDPEGRPIAPEECIREHLTMCPPPGPAPIDPCLEQRARDCEHLLEASSGDPNDPAWQDFELCMDAARHECPAPPHESAQCEQILRDGEQLCFGDQGMGPDGDPQRCFEEFDRAFRDCLDGGEPPGPDACLDRAFAFCRDAFQGEQPDPNDPATGDRFQACIDDQVQQCHAQDDPAARCEDLLRQADEVCRDDAACRAEFEDAFAACIGG